MFSCEQPARAAAIRLQSGLWSNGCNNAAIQSRQARPQDDLPEPLQASEDAPDSTRHLRADSRPDPPAQDPNRNSGLPPYLCSFQVNSIECVDRLNRAPLRFAFDPLNHRQLKSIHDQYAEELPWFVPIIMGYYLPR